MDGSLALLHQTRLVRLGKCQIEIRISSSLWSPVPKSWGMPKTFAHLEVVKQLRW